jgi:hypothetical protein
VVAVHDRDPEHGAAVQEPCARHAHDEDGEQQLDLEAEARRREARLLLDAAERALLLGGRGGVAAADLRTVDVPLSVEQTQTYKRVATAMQAMVKDKQITALNAGAAMNKLLQIAGGWVYTKNPEFVRLDPSPRIVAMADMIRAADEKVLVAIPYRHMIEGISKLLSMKGVDVDHCVVHGDTQQPRPDFQHLPEHRQAQGDAGAPAVRCARRHADRGEHHHLVLAHHVAGHL